MVHSSMASRLALFHLLLVTAPSLSAVAASVVTNGSDDSEGFRLSNSQWHITIDPVTLAMQAETTGKHHQTITLSLPILNSTEKVEVLSVGHEHAQWRWNSSQVAITASLSGQDFRVRFSRKTPGAIGWPLFPLNQKEGARALMFPKVEGMYIPLNDKEWRDDLINEPVSMTEGMSLPLLGVEYLCEKEKKCKGGKGTLSVIFPNPFNNMLEFSTLNGAGAKDISKNNEEMLVTAHHRFSKLDYKQSYELLFHLTPNKMDPLAPSKRYRQLIKSQGQFKSLREKLKRVGWSKTGQKLIGASHAYLWGQQLLVPQDVKDWQTFVKILNNSGNNTRSLANSLREKLSKDGQEALLSKDLISDRYTQSIITNEINSAITQVNITDQDLPETKFTHYPEDRQKYALVKLFQNALIPVERWGDGASVKMMSRLQESGLKRLFLGLPDYQAGFYHPEGVQAANNAGYLIGPYDSYNTAVPEGIEPSFRTAHLGQEVFEKCGVLLENGKRLPGFQGKGVYTNTPCVRKIFQERVKEVQKKTRNAYNSWFLDADASGMVHEDYDPAHTSSEAQDAKDRNSRMKWVATNPRLRLLAGSENGYSHVNKEIAFAHGMQNTMFGWGDPQMHKNKSSPYFLGGYFPDNQPATYFKPALIQSKYKQLYYTPSKRLPLFQAVFHDSVITTNHWLLDNLKLQNIQSDAELLQMLYNVPPMVHLNLATSDTRIQYLLRIDAFFRPLHERLAFQSLIDFEWLSNDRMVQATKFQDGTKLIANFGDQSYGLSSGYGRSQTCDFADQTCVEPHSIVALLKNGEVLRYKSGSIPTL